MKTNYLKISSTSLIDIFFSIVALIIYVITFTNIKSDQINNTIPMVFGVCIIALLTIRSFRLVGLKYDGSNICIKNLYTNTTITFNDISSVEFENLSRPPIGKIKLHSGKKYKFKLPRWIYKDLEPNCNCKTLFVRKVISRYEEL